MGRRPESYWDVEIAHVTHLVADDVGEMTPSDLMTAADLFDAKYRAADD